MVFESIEERDARAARLRQAREYAGHKGPTEAAAALRVSFPTYAGHENGSRGFRHRAAFYAMRFKVSLPWLLEGTGNMLEHPAIEIYDDLPADKRREWLTYGNFLKNND